MTMTSNLGWIIRQSLENWIQSYIVIGDSTISLCWITSDKKRLSLFHRNRCVQIRRGSDLEQIYHVRSEFNPADVATRPSQIKDSSVGPNSVWEKGYAWMRGEIDDAIADGILTPASDLRLNDDDEESYKKGLVFERTPDILTPGHMVLLSSRAEKVKERSEFSMYIIPPNKFKFEKTVRIIGYVHKFLKSFKCLKNKFPSKSCAVDLQMFFAAKGNNGVDEKEIFDGNKAEMVGMK